jgi:hypothetical protein
MIMKRTRILALAAALSAGISMPALAEWSDIGTVHFDYGVDRSSTFGSFGGPVRTLQFRAHNSDIDCRYVRATFGNGEVHNIFMGHIPQGGARNVDVPGGDQRTIRSLDFLCRSYDRRGADLEINADVGAYRDRWRRDPRWSRMFGQFSGGPSGPYGGQPMPSHDGDWWNNQDNWVQLGSEQFDGRGDRESQFTQGWSGRDVKEIALRPMGGDARCSKVVAWFGDGDRAQLDIHEDTRMEEGHFYNLAMPGNRRNIARINMVCSSIHQPSVTIRIYANK